MEKGGRRVQRAATAVLLLVLAQSVVNMGVEGKCVVKNQSAQPVAIEPVGAAVGVAVAVAVGVEVELKDSEQYCYVKNVHSGHKKGPVKLANGGTYVIVDGAVKGEVNLCVGNLVEGILISIGITILVGI